MFQSVLQKVIKDLVGQTKHGELRVDTHHDILQDLTIVEVKGPLAAAKPEHANYLLMLNRSKERTVKLTCK